MKLILSAFLFLVFSACTTKQQEKNSSAAATNSTTEINKALVSRLYYEMANKQNYALIDTFCAPDIIDHGALEGQQQGREGFKKAVIEFLGMFSQVEIKIEEMIAEGDLVSSRETWKVTMVSSGKLLTGETMHFFRIKEGMITDEWSKGWEWLGM